MKARRDVLSNRGDRDESLSKRSRPQKNKKNGAKLEDFEIKHLLGKGAFGEVYLALHKRTNRLMALKQMDKKLIEMQEKKEHVKNEKRVLIKGQSPYLVKLHFSFQRTECLYLAMEYCPGGDLREFLSAIGAIEEEDARIYFAQMIMAVHTLHQLGYIHRDLKPDNFLIDSTGHLKLADFGLSKASRVPVEDHPGGGGSMSGLSEKDLTKRQHRLSLLPKQTHMLKERLNERNIGNRFRRTTLLSATRGKASSKNNNKDGNNSSNVPASNISSKENFSRRNLKLRRDMAHSARFPVNTINTFHKNSTSNDNNDSINNTSIASGKSDSGLGALVEGSSMNSNINKGGSPGKFPVSVRKQLAYSVVGSPDYMSPEVTRGLKTGGKSGYGEEVDWWSLGCVFFEMILGVPPFAGNTPEEIFENIHNWRNIIPALLEQYKVYMSPECFSLLSGLLTDPTTRLGGDLALLQSQPFFEGIDWAHLPDMEAPFVPQPESFDSPVKSNDDKDKENGNNNEINEEK